MLYFMDAVAAHGDAWIEILAMFHIIPFNVVAAHGDEWNSMKDSPL